MAEELGRFIFLAVGAIAVFSFLSVGAWARSRKEERIAMERLALYRKLAESPAETVELVLARLREEDALQEKKDRERARQTVMDSRQGAAVVLAVGIGLSIFLKYIAPVSNVWSLGILVVLVGVVLLGFTFGNRRTV